jgi:3-hydroxyacyl-CoA dehydrogenase
MSQAQVRETFDPGIAHFAISAPPVNALSAAVRAELLAHIGNAQTNSTVQAIILTGEGRTFSAGADIKEFGKNLTPTLDDLLEVLELSSKHIIAVLNGAAAGGGLEIALACHFRVAAQSAKLSLPEVKLGLVPAGGGTQRLTRLVGAEAALEIMTSGRQVAANEALALKLVDAVFPDEQLQEAALSFARSVVSEPLRHISQLDAQIYAARQDWDTVQSALDAVVKRFRGAAAPRAIAECVRAAIEKPMEQGLELEKQLFAELLEGDQSKALRRLFFAERLAAQPPNGAKAAGYAPVQTVGIIGAGTMGTGIAMSFLAAGIPVTLVDVNPENLIRGNNNIARSFKASAQKGRIGEAEAGACTRRLSIAQSIESLSNHDLIIEAAFEDAVVKKSIFAELGSRARSDAILASNTSYLDIGELADQTPKPERVIGLHFFSPAHIMKLVEVVHTEKSAPAVIAAAMALTRALGKIPVLVGNAHGFVGNRMSSRRLVQARNIILEGATPWDVDRVFHDFGFPMGPFAMMDLAGLDLGWTPEKSRGATVAELLCEQGRRGQKTGAGYYDYDEQRQKKPSPLVEGIIRKFAAGRNIAQCRISDQEILERCLYPVVNEGVKILAAGNARRATDIDVVWVYGFGWPAYKGGPMYWADAIGLTAIVAALRKLEQSHGPDFTPAPLLERLAQQRERVSDFVVDRM